MIVASYLVVAVVGAFWTPHNPDLTLSSTPFHPPTGQYLLGTDVLGRDVLSRVMAGAHEVILIAVVSTIVSTIGGGALGLLVGYMGGVVDAIVMRAVEVLISIPFLMFALLMIAVAGNGGGSYALLGAIIVVIYAPRTARVARTVARELMTRDFVIAAQARGEPAWSVVRRELFPNATGPLLVEFGVRAGYAPILIGSLAFLGFGVQPPTPDWGLMINENRAAIATAPLAVIAPAVALAGLVVGLNLLTDGVARVVGRNLDRSLGW